MAPTALIAWLSLTSQIRSRVAWIWNGGILLLVLSLNHTTFFDFEGGSLVSELFLTTVTLSASIGLIVFFLGGTAEPSAGRWHLLLSRPMSPGSLVVGRWLGAVTFQAIVILIQIAAFLFDSKLLHRELSVSFGLNLSYCGLQIAMVAAYFSLVSMIFREFWAFSLMVGGILLGRLSELIMPWIPAHLGSVLFCIIPDLELSVTESMPTDSFETAPLFWKAAYSASYVALCLSFSSLVIRTNLSKRKMVR